MSADLDKFFDTPSLSAYSNKKKMRLLASNGSCTKQLDLGSMSVLLAFFFCVLSARNRSCVKKFVGRMSMQ